MLRKETGQSPAVFNSTISSDVVILGGGVSGIAAAVSAARLGSRVVLAERCGFLGGLATSAWAGTIAGAYYITPAGNIALANGGFAETLISALRRENGLGRIETHQDAVYVPYSPLVFKLVCDKLVGANPNISLLLHSDIVGLNIADGHISSLVLSSKASLTEIQAKIFIDCSGDANLSYMAGVPMQKTGQLQCPSTMFIVNRVNLGKARKTGLQKLSKIMLRSKISGDMNISRVDGFFFPTGRPGEVTVAMTRIHRQAAKPLNPLRAEDLTFGELQGRLQAVECFNLLKKHMPGFEKSYLSDIAPQLGVRESRRIKGRYILTRRDVLSGRRFADGIAWGVWPIELHTKAETTLWLPIGKGLRYQIPYRSLCPPKIDNLLVAGRCISASHEAMASSRVIGTCLAMGHSAGLIASRLAAEDLSTSQVNGTKLKQIVQEVIGRE